MKEVVDITKGKSGNEITFNFLNLKGKKVLSHNGYLLGTIKEVKGNFKDLKLEGIVVSNMKRKLFIGKDYFSGVTREGVLLKIDPFILHEDKKVITADGKVLGKVVEIIRKKNTNDIVELKVKSFFSRRFSVKEQEIDTYGKNIILKRKYNGKKKYFWQKSE